LSRNVKYDASKISERLRDHSLYIAFAPADKPRIALAVIVENAGFGAAAAAPIARMAMDYYLTGKRPDEPAKPVVKVADNPAQAATVKPDATKPDVTKPDSTKPDTAAVKPSAKPAESIRGTPQ